MRSLPTEPAGMFIMNRDGRVYARSRNGLRGETSAGYQLVCSTTRCCLLRIPTKYPGRMSPRETWCEENSSYHQMKGIENEKRVSWLEGLFGGPYPPEVG